MRNSDVKSITLTALFAAMIFVATMYIHIPIPSPTGPTMIKTGNILCLLAGLLLGKTRGGFAAGIGSALFDLSNPLYISSTPYTFCFFFIMAYVCGLIFEKRGLIISVICGAFSYVILYISKTIITSVLVGNLLQTAITSNLIKMYTSCFNAIVAITFSIILYPIFKKALNKIL